MRFAVLAALVLLSSCRNKSKLDEDRGAQVDALWALAPDKIELGIVASPRAVGLGLRALDAARDAIKQPDLELAKPQLDALLHSMFGSETATPEDAGFARDRAFALFVVDDGVLSVMPIGNRDKFMAARKGKRGSAEDTIETNTCRQLGAHYWCATQPTLFDRIGKGSLRGKLEEAGARGDAELFMVGVPLLGQNAGELMIAAQIEPGQVSLHGRWIGQPDGPLAQLVGIAAPRPDTNGASGFVALNVAPLLANAPAVPIAGGITFEQLAKSLAGPVTATIPAGSVDLQAFAQLTDPKPAQTIIDNCQDVGTFFKLAEQQAPGACRIVLEGTNHLELDAWVEGNTLRLGAKKGPRPAGKPGGMTQFGRELGNGDWSAAFWGRGTMLNLATIKPATSDPPREVALGVHAMALVNELGVGARVDKDGLRFRAVMRTAWANPPAVVAKILPISGADIMTGKATEPAKAIAASAPGTPFAADFDAGQGGLMVPAAMAGFASAVVIPAVMRMFGGDDAPPPDEELPPPMGQADLVALLLRAYTQEAYPKWKADNPGKTCPASLAELAKDFGTEDPDLPLLKDPWGNDLVMKCDAKSFSVMSLGPDGKAGTEDDLRESTP
ncbi:MAG TPA: type II secretion system protein GspG [Kofleriaceae bacterium]